MKIAFAASEIAPFAKTGGLADVTGSLPIELQALGHEIVTFLPRYKSVDLKKLNAELIDVKFLVPMGGDKEEGKIYRCRDEKSGITHIFLDHPEYFQREELYGTSQGDYPDNDHRFIFFQRGVLEALKLLKIKPDVIHCHDWQTGLIPVYLKTLYKKDTFFKKTKSVFTVHNLAYQGNFPPDTLPLTGISWDHFKLERLEFYGKVSFIKGGIVYSDVITTVSQSYAEEIQTKEAGCGMDGILLRRADDIVGILNGIDNEEWNPKKDKALEVNYDFKSIIKKMDNKAQLQQENRFELDPEIPVFGLISRLVDQKGIDILVASLPEMAKMGVQFVLLGTGEEKYHQILRDFGKSYRELFGIHIVFDSEMARRVYAGCDVLMIPSYYEPCGLAQMIALRYGTIPLVRAVGGLADTIEEFNSKTGKGNGFCFEDYTSRALLSSVKKALAVYKEKEQWTQLVKNAMECNFSWRVSAEKYIQLYQETQKKPIESLD